jgi:hypothetical protein
MINPNFPLELTEIVERKFQAELEIRRMRYKDRDRAIASLKDDMGILRGKYYDPLFNKLIDFDAPSFMRVLHLDEWKELLKQFNLPLRLA